MAARSLLIGATPPELRKPKRRPATVALQTALGRLKAAEKLTFQRGALPYLRVLFDGIVESQELGAFDAAGVDHLSVTRDGRLDVVVQCKGFSVTPAEMGSDQAKQCLKSIDRFRAVGRPARGYLLLHNRDHRNTEFTELVDAALANLRRDELVEWVAMWSPQDLLTHLEEELVHRVTENALVASAEAMRDASALLDTKVVEEVPFTDTEFMVRRGTVNPIGPPAAGSGDPAVRLQDSDDRITVLLGGFGFGKTTVAVRAVSTWGRQALFLPAARIGTDGQNLAALLLRGLAETTLAALPAEDQPALTGLVSLAVQRVLSSPRTDLALVLDALDEAPAIGQRNGLGAVLHALRTLRVPVIVTLRSELWNARIAELSVALSDTERATMGRAIRVLELGVWTAAQIVAFVDAVDHGLSPDACENLRAFRDLVLNGEYELYYGDIPCRPLFLRMVVDDVMVSGIRRRGRVDLFDEWITRKLIRDHQAPLDIGGEGRVSLLDRRSGLDEELRLARTVMVAAARAMVAPADDGTLVLTPYVTDDELRDRVPAHLNQFDLTGLVVGSLLVPTRTERPGRPLQLHFAHRAFQEFFFAESLLRTPDTETERLVPDSVRQWIDEMRRYGY